MSTTKQILLTAGGLMLGLGLVAVGQVGLGSYLYTGSRSLVIGDVADPYQYDGEDVCELELPWFRGQCSA